MENLPIIDRILTRLTEREQADNLRELKAVRGIDFCSNDYLGLARQPLEVHCDNSQTPYGSTGSRLISGHENRTADVEQMIAEFHGFEAALLFGAGYNANMGLLSALGSRGDIMLCDELIHASLIDGVRLTHSKRLRFKHNDLADLERQLGKHSQSVSGQIFVIVESVYSMDGDIAPLADIARICATYKAALIVDEAHSIGTFGGRGEGLVAHLGLQDQVLACVYTFGKAPGIHGAAVCGGAQLQRFLVNFCRPFIYSTAPAAHSVETVRSAYLRLGRADEARAQLGQVIDVFKTRISAMAGQLPDGCVWLESDTAIQGLIAPGNMRAKDLAAYLQDAGFSIKAILSPTVAQGEERLRMCLHSYDKSEHIEALANHIEAFFEKETV